MEERTGERTMSAAIPGVINIRDGEFWNDLMSDYIYGPAKSGCKICFDAVDSRLGVGKTSAALNLAYEISDEVGWELTEDDMVLSSASFLKRFREHPGTEQPSVIVLDEIVGAGGADSRRAMSNMNVNMARTFEIMRKKRIVVIMTTANYGGMDSRLRRLMDYVLTCQIHPKFYVVPYKVGTRFGSGDLRLRHVGARLRFWPLDGDPCFEELARQKDLLLESEEFDMDNVVEEEKWGGRTEVQRRKDAEDEAIADVIEYLTERGKDGKMAAYRKGINYFHRRRLVSYANQGVKLNTKLNDVDGLGKKIREYLDDNLDSVDFEFENGIGDDI